MYALRFVDAAVISLSYLLSYWALTGLSAYFNVFNFTYTLKYHVFTLSISTVSFVLMLRYFGSYTVYRDKSSRENFKVIKPIGSIVLIACSIFLFIPSDHINRLFVLMFCLLSGVMLIIERGVINKIFMHRARNETFCRNLLIIGIGSQARNYADKVSSHPEWGMIICGYIEEFAMPSDYQYLKGDIIGKINDLPLVIEQCRIDEVVIAVPLNKLISLDAIIHTCEEIGVDITILPIPCDTSIAKIHYSEFYATPLMVLSMTPCSELQLTVKTIFDLLSSLVMLILLSPLLALVALCIKLDSPGPVFYSQIRCGLNGRRFNMYKFRSMYVDSEQKLQDLLQHNQVDGPVFKMKHDPRVTRVGYWLRKLSIDELPQLLNVCRGEMSLIGPRPPLPHEIIEYNRSQRRRLSVVPGITGLWQVSGRSNLNFEKWIELDLYYIDHWSLWFDLKILFKTIPVVLFGKGAY